MGDCQSKNKAGDVSEPAIESAVKPSNESTKQPIKEAQESSDQKSQNGPVGGSVEEIPVKQKPVNGTSFGQNTKFLKTVERFIQEISGKLFQFTSAKLVCRLGILAGNFFA